MRGRWRFVARQVLTRRVAAYELRDCGLTVVVRHKSRDIGTLVEIFYRRIYDMAVGRQLVGGTSGPLRVLDLGAHIGLFGLYILGLCPEAKITAFEPDPANAAVLARCIGVNGLEHRWRLIEACAYTEDVQLPFLAGMGDASRALDSAEIGSTTVQALDVFKFLPDADLVKIDIEGGEWAILADPRLESLRAQLTVLEFHPSPACPEVDPLTAATAALQRVGYEVLTTPVNESGSGVLWARPVGTSQSRSPQAR